MNTLKDSGEKKIGPDIPVNLYDLLKKAGVGHTANHTNADFLNKGIIRLLPAADDIFPDRKTTGTRKYNACIDFSRWQEVRVLVDARKAAKLRKKQADAAVASGLPDVKQVSANKIYIEILCRKVAFSYISLGLEDNVDLIKEVTGYHPVDDLEKLKGMYRGEFGPGASTESNADAINDKATETPEVPKKTAKKKSKGR